eukprot:scaffold16.g116.t1
MSVPAGASNLAPFTSVALNTPFSVKIAPSTSGHSINVDAGKLVLDTEGEFTSKSAIKAVSHRGSGATVVAPGFSATALELVFSGSGLLVAKDVRADSVSLHHSGSGSSSVTGAIGSAALTLTGTGSLYVAEVSKEASVNLSGTGSVTVKAATPAVKIQGRSSGTGKGAVNISVSGTGGAPQQGEAADPGLEPLWSAALDHRNLLAKIGGFFGKKDAPAVDPATLRML